MNTGVLEAPAPQASAKVPAVLLSFVILASLGFVGAFAIPYFLSSSHGPPEYAPRKGWLLLHIAGGIVALLTGPVQLWLGLGDRAMSWHRRLGVAYLAGVGVGSIAGLYLAAHTDFGWVFGLGLGGLAIAWISTSALAYVSIRRSLIGQHKEWMIRSYVVTFAFVLFRIIYPALQIAQVGTIQEQLAAAAWGCWTLPLLFTELMIQGRKVLAVR